MNKKELKSNIIYAFTAQGVSLLLSVVMSFIVPRILGITEFAYWQLFTFYAIYGSFFHFGLNDGIYMKLGGKKYEEIEKDIVGTQLKIAIIVQLIILCLVTAISFLFINGDF